MAEPFRCAELKTCNRTRLKDCPHAKNRNDGSNFVSCWVYDQYQFMKGFRYDGCDRWGFYDMKTPDFEITGDIGSFKTNMKKTRALEEWYDLTGVPRL